MVFIEKPRIGPCFLRQKFYIEGTPRKWVVFECFIAEGRGFNRRSMLRMRVGRKVIDRWLHHDESAIIGLGLMHKLMVLELDLLERSYPGKLFHELGYQYLSSTHSQEEVNRIVWDDTPLTDEEAVDLANTVRMAAYRARTEVEREHTMRKRRKKRVASEPPGSS